MSVTKIDPRIKFNTQELNSIKRMIQDEVKSTVQKTSYFKLSKIINGVLKKAKKEEKFMKNTYLNDLVTELVYELSEDSNYLFNIERDKTKKTGNYTTVELMTSERKCIQLAASKNNDYAVPPEIVEAELLKMPLISDEQKEAVYHVCYGEQLVSIYQGLAGAGKSFTSKAIKTSFQKMNFAIKGLALSWNAAGVLSASAGIDDCRAIEAFCIAYAKASVKQKCAFEKDTLLIVDEAGLVGTKHMVQILEAAWDAKKNHNITVKVVLTGDALQLLPVNAGGMFKTLERYLGSSTIGTIRRQVQESQRKMVKLSSERRSGNALFIMQQQENIVWGTNHETTSNQLIRDYLSFKLANPKKTGLILALNNNHVIEMNNKVRAACKKLGFVKGIEIETTVSNGADKAWRSHFAAGDEVVIRTNYTTTPVYKIEKDNYDVSTYEQIRCGVFNRNNGRIVKIQESNDPKGSWDIFIDMSGDLEGRMIINTEKHLDGNALPMHHNYATTIYASQGQTVKQVFLMYDPKIDFRLFYVGISRHTDNCTFYLNENLLHRQMDIEAGKGGEKKYFDDNGEELLTQIGRYSRMEMLKTVSQRCGADKQNETVIDYMYKISNPEEKELNERELYEIKPANNEDNLMDFDNNYYVIDAEDVKDEKSINEWWGALYFKEKTVFCADQEKITQYRKDALEMNENVLKFKKEILSFNNLPEDYVIEEDDCIYYKEKVSVRFPIIDLQKLLEEEDHSYTKSVVIPQKEIDAKRFKKGIEGFIPVYDPLEEMNERIREENEFKNSPLGKLSFQDILNEIETYSNKPSNNEEKISDLSNDDILNIEETEIEDIPEKSLNKIAKTSQRLFKGLFKSNKEIQQTRQQEEDLEIEEEIKKIKIEYIKKPDEFIRINKKNKLEFVQPENAIGDEDFMDWINYSAKEEFWHKGKYHEPRFLALDSNGIIREKYDQFGDAKLGTGYPAILTNPKANDETPVWVVPGVIEWLWSYYYYMKRSYSKFEESEYNSLEEFYNNLSFEEKEKIIKTPEFIWGTKSTDYGIVKEYLKGRELKIIRGKDPKNEEWALNLREHLWKTWYMKSNIYPPIEITEEKLNNPKYQEPWINATEEELRIAEGNFKNGDLIREIAKIKK